MSDIDERVQSMRRFLYIHKDNVHKIAEHVDIEPIRLYAIAGGMDFYVSELADLESYLVYHQDELDKRVAERMPAGV